MKKLTIIFLVLIAQLSSAQQNNKDTLTAGDHLTKAADNLIISGISLTVGFISLAYHNRFTVYRVKDHNIEVDYTYRNAAFIAGSVFVINGVYYLYRTGKNLREAGKRLEYIPLGIAINF